MTNSGSPSDVPAARDPRSLLKAFSDRQWHRSTLLLNDEDRAEIERALLATKPAVEQDASVLLADLICRPYPDTGSIHEALKAQWPGLVISQKQLEDIGLHIGKKANDDVAKMNRSDITYIPAGPALRKVRESSPVGHFLLDQQADTWQQVAPEHADDTDVIPLYRLKA